METYIGMHRFESDFTLVPFLLALALSRLLVFPLVVLRPEIESPS